MLQRLFKKHFFTGVCFVIAGIFFGLTAHAVEVDFTVAQQAGFGSSTLEDIVINTIKIILGFLGLAAVLITLYGGYIWMSSGGNLEKITKAKKTLSAGVVGLAIVLSAFSIAHFIFGIFDDVMGGGGGIVNEDTGGGDGGCIGSACLAGGSGGFSVSSVNPGNGATAIALCRKVQAVFNSNVDSASVNSNNFKISYNNEGSQSVINGNYAVSANGLTFRHTELFPANKIINGYIADGTGSIRSTAGIEIASNRGRNWSFTTGTEVDSVLPTVDDVFPSSGMKDVCRNTTIEIVFSEIMDISTLNYDTIKLFDDKGNQINLSGLKITSTFDSVIIRPASTLEENKVYRVVASGNISDACDNKLDGNKNNTAEGSPTDDFVWTFTTGTEMNCSPIITNMSIQSGAYDSQTYEVVITGKYLGIAGDTQFGNLESGDNTFCSLFGTCEDEEDGFVVKSRTNNRWITRVPVGSVTSPLKIVKEEGGQSNAQSFTVLSPYLSGVEEKSGRAGNFFTLYGTNFGSEPGKVSFVYNDEEGNQKRIEAAQLCKENAWHEDYIVANVPDLPDAEYQIQIETATGLPSNIIDFTIDSTIPSNPGLCGAVPVCTNSEMFPVQTIGVNLGAVPGKLEFTLGTIEIPPAAQVDWKDNGIDFRVKDVKNGMHKIRATRIEGSGDDKKELRSNPVFIEKPCPPPSPLKPVIKSISPDNGSSKEGTNTIITILGDTLVYSGLGGKQSMYNGTVAKNFGDKGGVVYFCPTNLTLPILPGDDRCVSVSKGECFEWIDNEITVTTPTLAEGVYSVYVSKENIYTSDINPVAKFTSNSIVRPGLCTISPKNGPDNTKVTLTGKTLGDERADVDGKIEYYKNSSFGFSDNIESWTNKSITHTSVSNLPEQQSLVRAWITIPDRGQGGVLTSGTYQSNSKSFYSNPIIKEISPSNGPVGTYVSIFGKNFGNVPGRVIFKKGSDVVDAGGINCPMTWKDNYVIVSVPSGLETEEYSIHVIPYLPGGVESNGKEFTVNKEPLGPQLCPILETAQPFKLNSKYLFIGDNFGTTPALDNSRLSWSGIGGVITTTPTTTPQWSNTQGEFAVPNKEGAGRVKMLRTTKFYTGRKCTIPTFGGVCFTHYEDTFEDKTIESNLVPFEIGEGPRIIDNDLTCDPKNPKSLSPAPKSGETVCKQRSINLSFDKPIDPETLNSANIIINKRKDNGVGYITLTNTSDKKEYSIIPTGNGFSVLLFNDNGQHEISTTSYEIIVGNFDSEGIKSSNGLKMQPITISGSSIIDGFKWNFNGNGENCVFPANAQYSIANTDPLRLTRAHNTETLSTQILDPNTCNAFVFGGDTWTLTPNTQTPATFATLGGTTTKNITGTSDGVGILSASTNIEGRVFTDSNKIEVLYEDARPKVVVRNSCNEKDPQDYSPSPKNGANNVCTTSGIYIEYNKFLDPNSITTGAINIMIGGKEVELPESPKTPKNEVPDGLIQETEGKPIITLISGDIGNENGIIGFKINIGTLVVGSEYEISVNGVVGENGFPAEEYSWSFETGSSECTIDQENTVVRMTAKDPIRLTTYDPYLLSANLYNKNDLCQPINVQKTDTWSTGNISIAKIENTTNLVAVAETGNTTVTVQTTAQGLSFTDTNDVKVNIIKSCKDPEAVNYNPNATVVNNATCKYITVTEITPTSGRAVGDSNDTVVTITGSNFMDAINGPAGSGAVYFCPTTGYENIEKDCEKSTITSCGTWYSDSVTIDVPKLTLNKQYEVRVVDANGKIDRRSTNSTVFFTATNDLQPGLCSLDPISGTIGQKTIINGRNLGNVKNSSSVLFKTTPATILSSSDWSNEKVSASVPQVDETVNVSAKIQFGTTTFKNSNPLLFFAPPVITGISPEKGNNNAFITISGKNFGNIPGIVYFKSGNTDITAEFPTQCNTNWTNKTIVVKVPSGLSTNAKVRVIPGYQTRLVSNEKDFVYDSKLLVGPQLCQLTSQYISPETDITFNGENFTDNPGGKMIWSGINKETSYDGEGWTPTQVVFTSPDSQGEGFVRLEKKVIINTGKFTCQGFEFGNVCLGIRSDKQDITLVSNEIPFVLANAPEVVERTQCDGINPISPAPTKDSNNVCRNTALYLEFNQKIESSSLNYDNIVITRSGGPLSKVNESGDVLLAGKSLARSQTVNEPPDNDEPTDLTSFDYTIVPMQKGFFIRFNNLLSPSRLYTVRVSNIINSFGVPMSTPYEWSFTTQAQSCTPTKGTLSIIARYPRVDGVLSAVDNDRPITLSENYLSRELYGNFIDGQCIPVSLGDDDVVWTSGDQKVAKINSVSKIYSIYGISYGTTFVNASYASFTAKENVNVNISGDLITFHYPYFNQEDVCRNTNIAITFKENVALPLDETSIILESCGSESIFNQEGKDNTCVNPEVVVGDLISQGNRVFFTPSDNLKQNTIYHARSNSITLETGITSKEADWWFKTVNTNGLCTLETLRLTPLDYEFTGLQSVNFLAEALDGAGNSIQSDFSWKIDDLSLIESVYIMNGSNIIKPVGNKNGVTTVSVTADSGIAGNKTASTNITVNTCQKPWSGIDGKGELYDSENQFSLSYCLDGGNPNIRISKSPQIINTPDPSGLKSDMLAQYFMTVDPNTTPVLTDQCGDGVIKYSEQCDCGTKNICIPASLGNNSCVGKTSKNNIEVVYCTNQCKLNINSCFSWDTSEKTSNIKNTNGILTLDNPSINGSIEYIINSNISNHPWTGIFWNGNIPKFGETSSQKSSITMSYKANNSCKIDTMSGGAESVLLDQNIKTVGFSDNTKGSCLYIKLSLAPVTSNQWVPNTNYTKNTKLKANNQIYNVAISGYKSGSSIDNDVTTGKLENLTSEVSPSVNSIIISGGESINIANDFDKQNLAE